MEITKPLPANIRVFCRFRPFNSQELSTGNTEPVHHILSDQNLTIRDLYKQDNLSFSYDKIFDTKASQEDIYNEVGAPVLQNILEGFNGTIIAYGQTSSGKTYTIQGNNSDNKSKGLIPRIIQNLFIAIENSPATIQYKIKVSIIELYMEKIYDLINCQKTDLKIRQSKQHGNYVQNKTEVYISDRFEVMRLINIAQKNRAILTTNMNANSSRSHLVFQLNFTQFNLQSEHAKVSNLFIIDLAGSQKVSKTGVEGRALDQARKINLSLTSLAKVIKSLAERTSYIPYRDSKLTRIIQDSLGGNSKTTLILTNSPHFSNLPETISTLRFGETAQKIKNKAKINRQPTIKQLQQTIERLQNRIRTKDLHIRMLTQFIKKRLNLEPPKFNEKKMQPRSQSDLYYQSQTLLIGQEKEPIYSLIESQEQNLTQKDLEQQFSKYLTFSCDNIPEIIPLSEIYSQQGSKNDQDEIIQSLESEIKVMKHNLEREQNKYNSLRKDFDDFNASMDVILQQNVNNKLREVELLEQIKILRKLNRFKSKTNLAYSSQNLLLQQEEKPSEKVVCELKEPKNIQKIEQENGVLSKFCEDLRLQKQLLQTKIAKKNKKIHHLQSMMQQIKQKMEQLISDEIDQQMSFNQFQANQNFINHKINTRIANPVQRGLLSPEQQ